MPTGFALVIIIAAALLVMVLLAWKNKKDKKLLDPGAGDSVEDAVRENEQRKDKV